MDGCADGRRVDMGGGKSSIIGCGQNGIVPTMEVYILMDVS